MYSENYERWRVPALADISYLGILRYDPETGKMFTERECEDRAQIARQALTQIRGGQRFDDVAMKEVNGGVVGAIRGRLQISRARDSGNKATVQEIEQAAFTLRTNEVSDIIASPSGYYIIYLHDIIPSHIAKLTEEWIDAPLVDMIKRMLRKQKIDKLLPMFERQLRKDSRVDILDKRLLQESESLLNGQ